MPQTRHRRRIQPGHRRPSVAEPQAAQRSGAGVHRGPPDASDHHGRRRDLRSPDRPEGGREFDDAVDNNELVAPPAGAIGRGDAFVLTIANKAGATDPLQRLLPGVPRRLRWLFDEGRLIGGKPVPNVGWVFVTRVPVRGPDQPPFGQGSQEGQQGVDERGQDPQAGRASVGLPPDARSGRAAARDAGPVRRPGRRPDPRGAAVTARGRRRGRRADRRRAPVRSPQRRDQRVCCRSSGSSSTTRSARSYGIVESYSVARRLRALGDVRGYVPLRLMADPPPRSAREVMELGESRRRWSSSASTPRDAASTSPCRHVEPADVRPAGQPPAKSVEAAQPARPRPAAVERRDRHRRVRRQLPAPARRSRTKATPKPSCRRAASRPAQAEPAPASGAERRRRRGRRAGARPEPQAPADGRAGAGSAPAKSVEAPGEGGDGAQAAARAKRRPARRPSPDSASERGRSRPRQRRPPSSGPPRRPPRRATPPVRPRRLGRLGSIRCASRPGTSTRSRPAAAGRGVARRGAARCGVHAGDEARRRRLPGAGVPALGYETAHHGQGQWNGVAILSRSGSTTSSPTSPTASRPDAEARLDHRHVRRRADDIASTCPTGAPSTTSTTSTSWLAGPAAAPRRGDSRADRHVVVAGDFNIAPDGPRCVRPGQVRRRHPRQPARARRARRALEAWGLERRVPSATTTRRGYSWWDYRAGDFHQGRGMRIDLVLALRAGRRARRTWCRDRPQRPQGQAAVRPRARRRRTSTGLRDRLTT